MEENNFESWIRDALSRSLKMMTVGFHSRGPMTAGILPVSRVYTKRIAVKVFPCFLLSESKLSPSPRPSTTTYSLARNGCPATYHEYSNSSSSSFSRASAQKNRPRRAKRLIHTKPMRPEVLYSSLHRALLHWIATR